MARVKPTSWQDVVSWSAMSGVFVLAIVTAIFTYVYFMDGATKVWIDGLTAGEFALQLGLLWLVGAALMFGWLARIRLMENESIAKAGDYIDSIGRK